MTLLSVFLASICRCLRSITLFQTSLPDLEDMENVIQMILTTSSAITYHSLPRFPTL